MNMNLLDLSRWIGENFLGPMMGSSLKTYGVVQNQALLKFFLEAPPGAVPLKSRLFSLIPLKYHALHLKFQAPFRILSKRAFIEHPTLT